MESGAITINEKTWYYHLLSKKDREDSNSSDINSSSAPKASCEFSNNKSKKAYSARRSPTKTGLCDVIDACDLGDKLIICMMTSKGVRLFTYFNNHYQFAIFMRKIPVANRSFYEIILGNSAQKPHFDIDVSKDALSLIADKVNTNPDSVITLQQLGQLVLEATIEAVIDVLNDMHVNIDISRDILVYTSHSKSSASTNKEIGESCTKLSYHLIVNNYYHINNKEAKEFHRLVIEKIEMKNNPILRKVVESNKIIDPAVYSRTQQFRILGCQKIGSNRPKIFSSQFSYKNNIITHSYLRDFKTLPEDERDNEKFIIDLENSLISFTATSFELPLLLGSDSGSGNSFLRYDADDLPKEFAERALAKLAELANMRPNDPQFPYTLLGVKGGIILLKRHHPSRCRICARVHENENPYLICIGSHNSDGSIRSSSDTSEISTEEYEYFGLNGNKTSKAGREGNSPTKSNKNDISFSEEEFEEMYGIKLSEEMKDINIKEIDTPQIAKKSSEDDVIMVTVLFHCRRAPIKKRLMVGQLPLYEKQISEEEKIVTSKALESLKALTQKEIPVRGKNINKNRNVDSSYMNRIFDNIQHRKNK